MNDDDVIRRELIESLYALMRAELNIRAIHQIGQIEAIIKHADTIIRHLDAIREWAD